MLEKGITSDSNLALIKARSTRSPTNQVHKRGQSQRLLVGGGQGTHKSTRTIPGGGIFRNASLEMHKFVSTNHLKASTAQKPSGPNG